MNNILVFRLEDADGKHTLVSACRIAVDYNADRHDLARVLTQFRTHP